MYLSIEENPFIDKTLFTPKNTPLPLSDTETLRYYARGVQFFIQFGSGTIGLLNKFMAGNGILFLTDRRMIYKAESGNFVSFAVPLSHVVGVYKEDTIDIHVVDEKTVTLYLTFYEAQKSVFFSLLRELKDQSLAEADQEMPLYCEIIEKSDK